MNDVVLPGSQSSASSQHKPGVGWVILGFVVGWGGFLAMTGAACGEGLLAGIAGAVAGAIWRAFAIRRKLSRGTTFIGGLAVITICTLAIGFIGRGRAPTIIFQNAFEKKAPESVQFVNSRRFGYMDNTSLVVMKIDKPALDRLLQESDFKAFDDATQWLKPPTEPSLRLADHERHFRTSASLGGPFSEELPFHSDLSVYERRIEHPSGGLKRNVTVTWDPKTALAYVFVADY